MAFLKTLLIILLVYYLLKMVLRLLAPKIFSYAAKKTEAHFQEKFGNFMNQDQNTEQRVGDVIIDKNPDKKGSSSQNVGEYIDFEELD